MRAVILFACLMMLTACGGDDDGGSAYAEFEGTYKMTVHKTTNDCESPEDQWQDGQDKDIFFKLESQNLMGMSILAWYDCNNATDCEDEFNLLKSFAIMDGKPMTSAKMTMGTGDTCTYVIGEGTLELTETGVKWTTIQKSIQKTGVSEEECDTDYVDQLVDEMNCDTINHFEATLQ